MRINDNHRYLTKLVGEIFLWYKYPCYVNDISRNELVRYFCVTIDKSDTRNTANSSDASKTSASVTRLLSHFTFARTRCIYLRPIENNQ